MTFKKFRNQLNQRLDWIIENSSTLFVVDLEKEVLWDMYINSFTKENDPLYVTETVHTCNNDKSWIRNCAGIVGIVNNKLVSIWEIDGGDVYSDTCNKMSELVLKTRIRDIFCLTKRPSRNSSTAVNQFRTVKNEDGTYSFTTEPCPKYGKTFHHFFHELDGFIKSDSASVKAKVRSSKEVIQRSFEEINRNSLQTVIDLINNKNLYRGEEFLERLIQFQKLHNYYYDECENTNLFVWETAYTSGRLGAIKNSAIGTLLVNLSEDMDLETAVKKYESVVAPSNYKRPKPLVTEAMKKKAVEKMTELDLIDSLESKYANLADINIQNVIWASGESKKLMQNPFDLLKTSNKSKPSSKGTNISIESLMELLPNTKKVEVLFENKHQSNLVSLLSQSNLDAKPLTKWNNGFRWSYNGGVADSNIKESVKTRGGKVDGILRFSIMWAEGNTNDNSDLDAHCQSPKSHIYFPTPKGYCGGRLDVDIRNPRSKGNKNIVENITWDKCPNGDYVFWVNNYADRNSKGFKAEIEFNGTIFSYEKVGRVGNKDLVATVSHKNGEFTIKHHMEHGESTKEVWNISTQQYIPVEIIMFSPNYWDNKTGNKHYFFFLENCINPNQPRSFFNEFLPNELNDIRKIMEALGDKMRVPHTNEQLSGLGFSSTKNNELNVKLDGRPYKVVFNTSKVTSTKTELV